MIVSDNISISRYDHTQFPYTWVIGYVYGPTEDYIVKGALHSFQKKCSAIYINRSTGMYETSSVALRVDETRQILAMYEDCVLQLIVSYHPRSTVGVLAVCFESEEDYAYCKLTG